MTGRLPPILSADQLSVTFADGASGLHALGQVSFEVCPQEFICLLGPSGSGKSTLLRVLAGLVRPTSGEIRFHTDHPPRFGVVFQQSNLMPWRTVRQNILLPLQLQNTGQTSAQEKVNDMINLVGLQGFEDSLPRDLSGGMAQRVALARALIHDPDMLLLDEPFGSLDALTRERMWLELSNIWQASRKTVIMVTHSITEALLLADRVLVLSARPGKIKLDLSVDLPRPRQEDIRYTEGFGRLARQLKQAIE